MVKFKHGDKVIWKGKEYLFNSYCTHFHQFKAVEHEPLAEQYAVLYDKEKNELFFVAPEPLKRVNIFIW